MDLLSLLVTILIVGIIIWLLLYIINLLPLPAPFGQIARVIVIVIALIWLIRLLVSAVGVVTIP